MEPLRASGSVKEARPEGEAGFVSERRRPPSVSMLPAAAAPHSSAWVRAGDRRVVVRGRGPRDVRVGLRPHLDPEVVHAGRQRRRRSARPAAAARWRPPGCATPRRPSGPSPVGTGHHGVRPSPSHTTSSPQAQAAPEHDRCRASASGRSTQQPAAVLDLELVDEQRGDLGHPVGVRRRPTARCARRSRRRRT